MRARQQRRIDGELSLLSARPIGATVHPVNVLWVGLGGALGSIARYLLGTALHARLGETFPFGTLAVNLIGAFLIAFITWQRPSWAA